MRRVLVLALLSLAADTLAQTPGAPVISGRVLADGTGIPLRRARIELSSRSWRTEVLTDDNGRFVADVGGAGAVTLAITKGGYVAATVVIQRENVSRPIELHLPRGAAISGVVLDMKGAPAAGYPVTIRRVGANPERDGSPAQFTSTTDDRGEYRAGGLPRGTYDVAAGSAATFIDSKASDPSLREREIGLGTRVQVQVDTGDELGRVQLVAPALTGGEALVIALRDQAGVPPPGPRNFVPARGAAGTIRGRVLTADRTPVAGATVRVRGSNASSNAGAIASLSARTDEKGAFEVLGLRAGRYTVEASVNGQMVWRHGQDRVGQDGRPIALATDQSVNADVILPAAR
ncbi:MAG TPA: carboxypeptidase-like regulatory domain-containing protein, partial [Vicinamibacterales bacterium]|nr:carboxypeptidase-like regulatory domain-containing protein [Vicinamibacterales bacterium]